MYLLTRNRNHFNFDNPSPHDVHLVDILYALPRIVRFGGFAAFEYSVAQHSISIMQYLAKTKAPAELQLAGLLHSAHKAYLGEMTQPVSFHLNADSLQAKLKGAVAEAFGISPDLFKHPLVVKANNVALAVERHALLPQDTDAWPCLESVTNEERALMPSPMPASRKYLTTLQYLDEYRHLHKILDLKPFVNCEPCSADPVFRSK